MDKLKKDLNFMAMVSLISYGFFVVVGFSFIALAFINTGSSIINLVVGLGFVCFIIGSLLSLASIDKRGARQAVVKPYGYIDFVLKLSFIIMLYLNVLILELQPFIMIPIIIIFLIGLAVTSFMLYKRIHGLNDQVIIDTFSQFYTNYATEVIDEAFKHKKHLGGRLWWLIFIFVFVRFEVLSFNDSWLMWLFYLVYGLFALKFLHRNHQSNIYHNNLAFNKLQYYIFGLSFLMVLLLEYNTTFLDITGARLLIALLLFIVPIAQYFIANHITEMTKYTPNYKALIDKT